MRLFVGLMAALLLTGCATEQQMRYKAAADAESFDQFYSGPAEAKTFPTLEAAEDYVGTAQIKLEGAIAKRSVMGLAAYLKGPEVSEEQPVVVVHYFAAATRSNSLDLDSLTEPLEKTLRRAISVTSVFLVFYEGLGVSISDFYLDSEFRYSSNSQIKTFGYKNARYAATYPIGWGNSQAFAYLRKPRH
jgi:hypothetical protein